MNFPPPVIVGAGSHLWSTAQKAERAMRVSEMYMVSTDIVDAVLENLESRKGFSFSDVDEATQAEIHVTLAELVFAKLREAQNNAA